MHPDFPPSEPGCIVHLVQRGEPILSAQAATITFGGLTLPCATVGLAKPTIWRCTLWAEGMLVQRDVHSDLLSMPAPGLTELLRWFAEHPERWTTVKPTAS